MTDWEEGWDQNIDFWSDILNPWGYVDFALEPTWDKAEDQAIAFGVKSFIATTAATGVWALSGGGASMGMWFGASPPTAKRMMFLKAAGYKEAFAWIYRNRAPLAKGVGYALAVYVGYQGYRHRYSSVAYTAGDDVRTHVGGGYSFRNPITGM